MTIQERRYTLDDLHRIEDLPENADKIFELIDGEIVEVSPSFEPSEIGMWIASPITAWVRRHKLGHVSGSDGGYVMDAEGNKFNPDFGFISNARMSEKPKREALVPPDFAVEVKSPTDRKSDVRKKVRKYLEVGTRMVWLVFPEDQSVEVYVPDQAVVTLHVGDTLDGGDVLPGFTLPVADIFPWPPE